MEDGIMTFDKVKDVIVETINCAEEDVVMDADLKEGLHMDSLDAMEVSMALEEAFNLTIDEESLMEFKTVKDIVDYIDAHMA